MLLGLVHPSAGSGFLLGKPCSDVQVRRRVGFLPEDFRFYDWLTPPELLALHGRLSGLTPAQLSERIPRFIELVGLTPHAHLRLRGFSKGMLQRIGLAQALIHEPDLIFLDEPTSGLDPMGRRLVRDIIRSQRDRGATVFLNSHLLSEVEITCDTVVFIKQGQVVATRDLRSNPQGDIRVSVRAHGLTSTMVNGLSAWCGSSRLEADHLFLTTASLDSLPEILRHLVTSGASVFEFTPERLSLEDTFLKVMGEDQGF